MLEFEFPSTQQLEAVKDLNHLKLLVSEHQREYGGELVYIYRFRKNKYIYAQCKLCHAYLHYRREGDNQVFALKKLNNSHSHPLKTAARRQRIHRLIEDLPDSLSMKAAKAIAMNEIQMTTGQFYYFYSKIKNPKLSYPELLQYLDSQKYEVQTDPFFANMQAPPDLFVVVSPIMKTMFLKYGQCASFDMTFNVIKQQPEGKSWKTGILVGRSWSKRITPFALVLSTELTSQRYTQIFKSVFDIMGRTSRVVISDEQAAIASALRHLKELNDFDGQHCLDLFHILRNTQRKLKNKENIKHFSRLARTETQSEFNRLYEAISHMIEQEDLNQLKKFVENRSKYCFAFLITGAGFVATTNLNEKYHDLLKQKVTHQIDFSRGVIKILQVIDKLLLVAENYNLEKQHFQQYFNFAQLKEIRYRLDKSVFRELCQQLSRTISLDISLISLGRYQITHIKSGDVFLITDDNCSCQYQTKTGLPCSHLIKSLLTQQRSILQVIDERWKISHARSISIKVGRRHTRKRRPH